MIWHAPACLAPVGRTRARQAARRHLADVLASPRELAPVYARHLADV